jgi:hypothetical protein
MPASRSARVILVIIGLLWVALLAPMAVRRFRDHGAERSIESFHAEHEVLERHGYSVAPAYRLSEEEAPPVRRPSLTVVHADDTYRSLESRGSWEEWDRAYDYDDSVVRPSPQRESAYPSPGAQSPLPTNRYAAAYAAVPRGEVAVEAPLRRRSARAQRRMVATRLVGAAVVMTALSFFVSSSIVLDVAVLAWVLVGGYVALALYAIAQGFLEPASLGLGRRSLAPIETLPVRRGAYELAEESDEYGAYEEFDDDGEDGWGRSSSRYALG